MDLVGPLPPSQGGNRFIVVAVEYFTRWIEAKPLAKITSETVRKFFWQNIICRFGVPRILTVDNGKQFDSEKACTLFLIGELQAEVRFLTRQAQCKNPLEV